MVGGGDFAFALLNGKSFARQGFNIGHFASPFQDGGREGEPSLARDSSSRESAKPKKSVIRHCGTVVYCDALLMHSPLEAQVRILAVSIGSHSFYPPRTTVFFFGHPPVTLARDKRRMDTLNHCSIWFVAVDVRC